MTTTIKNNWRLRRDQDGQILIFTILVLFVLILFLITIPNVTNVVNLKIRTQTAADAGAYSAAVWMARGLNMIMILNIGIRQCYYWIAALVAIFVICSILVVVGAALMSVPIVGIIAAVLGTAAAIVLSVLFCGPTAPCTHCCFLPQAALCIPLEWRQGLKEDIERLYSLAGNLYDLQDKVSEHCPKAAFLEGTRIASINMGPAASNPLNWRSITDIQGGIVLYPSWAGRIPLQDMDGDDFLEIIQGFARSVSTGGASIGFDSSMNIGGNAKQKYVCEQTFTLYYERMERVYRERDGFTIVEDSLSPFSISKSYANEKLEAVTEGDTVAANCIGYVKDDIEAENPYLTVNNYPDSVKYTYLDGKKTGETECDTTITVADSSAKRKPLPRELPPDWADTLYTAALTLRAAPGALVGGGSGAFGDISPLLPGFGFGYARPFSLAYDRKDKNYPFIPDWDARMDTVRIPDSSPWIPAEILDVLREMNGRVLFH
jgi:hypothetical protein